MSSLEGAIEELEEIIKDMHSIDELRAFIKGFKRGKRITVEIPKSTSEITKVIPVTATPNTEKKYHRWTEEETKYLKENMETMTVEEIAEHLGIGVTKVLFKIKNMKHAEKKRKQTHRDSEMEEKIFEDYIRGGFKLDTEFRKFVNKKYNLTLTLHTVMGIIADRKAARKGHTCIECPKLQTKNGKPYCEVRKKKVHPDQPICKDMMGEI